MSDVRRIGDLVFPLPVEENRKVPISFLREIHGRGGALDPKAIDSYIFYRFAIVGCCVCFLFSMLNYFSYALGRVIDLQFLVINSTGDEFLKNFMNSYTKYTSAIMYLLVMPYYLLAFRYHVRPAAKDIDHWRFCGDGWSKNKQRLKFWSLFLVLSLGAFVGAHAAQCIPIAIIGKTHFINSFPWFITCLLILPALEMLYCFFQFKLFVIQFRHFSQRREPLDRALAR